MRAISSMFTHFRTENDECLQNQPLAKLPPAAIETSKQIKRK